MKLKIKVKSQEKKRSKGDNKKKNLPEEGKRKGKGKKLSFNKCKALFMKSALKSNKENLEVIENELKTLLVDLAAIYDVSPNNIEVLSAKISDMNNPNYNKDTHIKFQFLMAMKQTMEIGNLIKLTLNQNRKR